MITSTGTPIFANLRSCGCRVNIGGETKFACVDGPDFDGFKVDFDECMQRQGMFREEEHECRIGRGM